MADEETPTEPTFCLLQYPDSPEPSSDQQSFDLELFIEGFKAFPCLWNTSLVSYKDKNCKMNAWEKLSQMFEKDGKY